MRGCRLHRLTGHGAHCHRSVWQAMDNLKAHTMSYAPSKGAYESYFRRIESRYSNVYFAPTAEEKTVLPELLATSVLFAPVLAVAYVVLRR